MGVFLLGIVELQIVTTYKYSLFLWKGPNSPLFIYDNRNKPWLDSIDRKQLAGQFLPFSKCQGRATCVLLEIFPKIRRIGERQDIGYLSN